METQRPTLSEINKTLIKRSLHLMVTEIRDAVTLSFSKDSRYIPLDTRSLRLDIHQLHLTRVQLLAEQQLAELPHSEHNNSQPDQILGRLANLSDTTTATLSKPLQYQIYKTQALLAASAILPHLETTKEATDLFSSELMTPRQIIGSEISEIDAARMRHMRDALFSDTRAAKMAHLLPATSTPDVTIMEKTHHTTKSPIVFEAMSLNGPATTWFFDIQATKAKFQGITKRTHTSQKRQSPSL